MPAGIKRKKLLVEGSEDKRVIPELIEANGIRWGETAREAIIHIQDFDGIENLLAPHEISTQLKESGLEILGIMVDADDIPEERWTRIREECMGVFPELPRDFPKQGLIYSGESGLKLGVWIMPDNQARGMLETFLAYLVPDHQINSVWKHVESSLEKAISIGAPCKENHLDKAKVHTWLAWQEPPGRQLHNAVMERIFVPSHPKAQAFVQWFRELYEI